MCLSLALAVRRGERYDEAFRLNPGVLLPGAPQWFLYQTPSKMEPSEALKAIQCLNID